MLTPSEQELAVKAGTARYARRRAAGSQQKYGRQAKDHTVELEIEACGAEIITGRTIGREWEDTDEPDYDGDVGPGVQVRHTRYPNGRLILHDPQDKDDHDFFLVTGIYPALDVVGWIGGAKGKQVGVVRELQPGRPCICVEQRDLANPGTWVDPLVEVEEPEPVAVVSEPSPEMSPDDDGSPTVERINIPEFVRRAIVAQGICDPDEIAVKAAKVDLSAPDVDEQMPLISVPATRRWWED